MLENLDGTNIRGGATPHDRLKSFRGDANELKENNKDANKYEISHERGSCTSDPFKESGWQDLRTSDPTSSEVEKRKQKKETKIVVKEESEKERVNKQR